MHLYRVADIVAQIFFFVNREGGFFCILLGQLSLMRQKSPSSKKGFKEYIRENRFILRLAFAFF